MYGGRAVEQGPRTEVFHRPRHPYTWGLLGSVPRARAPRVHRLPTIAGAPPASPLDVPPGCPFAPRCAHVHDACAVRPPLEGAEHRDACWLPAEGRASLRAAGDLRSTADLQASADLRATDRAEGGAA